MGGQRPFADRRANGEVAPKPVGHSSRSRVGDERRLDGDIASQLFAFNLDYPGHTGLGPCQQREAERGIVNLSQAGPCF